MPIKKYSTEEERIEARKEQRRLWWIANRDKLKNKRKEYQHNYYLENKDRLTEKQRKYNLEHKIELSETHKKYYQSNKESILAKNTEYNKEHREECNNAVLKYRRSHPVKYLLVRAKTNSRSTGRSFDLTEEDIYIPEKCPYLNIPIIFNAGVGKRDHRNVSIDRIDSSKGYVKGNVQIISYLANVMKNDATEEQLIAFAKGVLRIHAGIDVDKISPEFGELRQVPTLYSNQGQ